VGSFANHHELSRFRSVNSVQYLSLRLPHSNVHSEGKVETKPEKGKYAKMIRKWGPIKTLSEKWIYCDGV
jgi:hypothetical protein